MNFSLIELIIVFAVCMAVRFYLSYRNMPTRDDEAAMDKWRMSEQCVMAGVVEFLIFILIWAAIRFMAGVLGL